MSDGSGGMAFDACGSGVDRVEEEGGGPTKTETKKIGGQDSGDEKQEDNSREDC